MIFDSLLTMKMAISIIKKYGITELIFNADRIESVSGFSNSKWIILKLYFDYDSKKLTVFDFGEYLKIY